VEAAGKSSEWRCRPEGGTAETSRCAAHGFFGAGRGRCRGRRPGFCRGGALREQAIEAYTSGEAYAEFAEKSKGELIPGQWADLVVLDRDIAQIPAEQILATKVLRTVVGGKTVYEASQAE
jgi:N-acyl-D-aspartate/D-glutamate deacylase